VDSLCIASRTHSFFITYRYLACSGSDAHLRPLYLKFNNRIKIDFFVSIIEYQKNSSNVPSPHYEATVTGFRLIILRSVLHDKITVAVNLP